MKREKFSSRLGFILISAGCAIGLGNVWRFPYITGKYGGAALVLLYIFFLLILGLPIMVAELAVGRASQRSAAQSFDVLEPKGTKWHWYNWGAMAGNYLLMMFYTTIAGWMLYYVYKMARTQMDDYTALIEYSTGNEKGKFYGVDNGDTLLLAFRAYMDETNVGASYYEIVYDRAIVFHKK